MTLIPNPARIRPALSVEAGLGFSPPAPPRYFDPRAKATEVEPGTAVGTSPRKTINHRAGLQVGVAATRIAAEGEQAGNSLSRPHDFSPRSPEQAPEAEWKEGTWNR